MSNKGRNQNTVIGYVDSIKNGQIRHIPVATSRVGIGMSPIPKGGIGSGKFFIHGADSDGTAGPYIQITTDADDYPLYQVVPLSHDSIHLSFDAVYNGTTWTSCDAGSNFVLSKAGDELIFYASEGNSQGSDLAGQWVAAVTVDLVRHGNMYLNGPAATRRRLYHQTAGSTRWGTGIRDTNAEAGSNAGSDWALSNFSDAGSFLGTVIGCKRDTGFVGIGHSSPVVRLDIDADSLRVQDSQSPASNGTGVQGEIAWDADYIYVCTATNTWKRAALTGGY